jgi:prepilin-type N-terminal cleavage/methylation domain-containing protein
MEFRKGKRTLLLGMTLVEVMVAIGILAVGMGGFSILFIRSWRTNGFVLESGMAASAASRVVRETVSELRRIRQADNGDYPLESGDDFDLEAYIDIDGDGATERVHYFLQDGDFRRGVTEPLATIPVTYPSGDDVVETLASDIANESGEPVFEYYNEDYPGDIVNNPLSTPVAISDVRLVKVRLVINIDPLNAPDDTNIESMAQLRNLNSYVP